MSEELTPLLQAVAEHGGTELELKYNDFFTATFRTRSQVTGQVGTRSGPGRDQVLRPLIEQGWLEMTIPDKPTSSKQKYRLTVKGRSLLQQEGYHE